jgi:hypothetical protein
MLKNREVRDRAFFVTFSNDTYFSGPISCLFKVKLADGTETLFSAMAPRIGSHDETTTSVGWRGLANQLADFVQFDRLRARYRLPGDLSRVPTGSVPNLAPIADTTQYRIADSGVNQQAKLGRRWSSNIHDQVS